MIIFYSKNLISYNLLNYKRLKCSYESVNRNISRVSSSTLSNYYLKKLLRWYVQYFWCYYDRMCIARLIQLMLSFYVALMNPFNEWSSTIFLTLLGILYFIKKILDNYINIVPLDGFRKFMSKLLQCFYNN